MTWQMDRICLSVVNQRNKPRSKDEQKAQSQGRGWRQPLVWMARERGWVERSCCKRFFWGDATPQHTRGQPKVWSNHRLLNALNIGGLIGSVEKGRPDSERTHTHTHKISLLHLPNDLATAENKRKLLTAQMGSTVNQPFSRQSKIVGQNIPQGQNKLRLSRGFLTSLF